MASDSKIPTPAGEVILAHLERQSLSMAEVERRTALSKNTIANAIYGPRQPQRKTIEILAEVLGLPVESLTLPGAPPSLVVRFEGFGTWLLRWRNGSLWIGILGAALTALLLKRSLSTPHLSSAVQGVQFLVILVLLTRLPRGIAPLPLRTEPEQPLRLALAAATDLRRYWGAIWMAWLFLYLGLTAAAFLGVLPSADLPLSNASRWLVVGLNLVQNSATVLLFLAYEVVARPTIAADLSRKQVLPLEAWLAIAVLLPLLEAAVLALGIGWELQQWFGWLSGFGQGTALALFVGRLDSKYIDPPPWVIASLYLYACIQGAWPVFQSHPQLMLVLTFLALVLKCLLFLFVAWLFESRVLLYFLERLRQLDEGVRKERSEFLSRLP
ncbi:MAG: hypothetical protein K0U98_24470 [Deltaproteobacteria bacterium]|nr:hypothetical protein [Deltaproteobacteria bacterium]